MQVSQREGEPPDLFAMRAYVEALPHMNNNELRAFINWIYAHGSATLAKRMEPPCAA